ncbi:MAG: hypothetical protein SFU91_01190 [Chloroherpetonaceae bacterium]|nr:hypothetical protein [Chloroherpetonaceae bacterium]
MANHSIELEAEAIKTLSNVLENLNPQSRNAVVEYVFRRLNLVVPGSPAPEPAVPAPTGKKRGRKPGTKLAPGKRKPGRPAKVEGGTGKRRGRPRKSVEAPVEPAAAPVVESQPQM